MSTLIEGGSYGARRNGAIRVFETEKGALMASIPYVIPTVSFEGEHSLVLGAKDGSMQERNIQAMQEHFGWAGEIGEFTPAAVDGDGPQFKLVDWHNEPYEKNGETVDKWVFRWLNRIGSGQTPEQIEAAKSKWGKKISAVLGLSATETKPAAKASPKPEPEPEAEPEKAAAPKRKLPAKAAAKKEPRKSSAEEVMELLVKKYHPTGATDDQQQELGDKYFFPSQDKLFGVGVAAESPEQWGQVADDLGI